MALRSLLHYGQSGKCLFLIINSNKNLLEIQNSSRFIRGFKRLRKDRKCVEQLTSKLAYLWKPLGFVALFGGASNIGAAIWEYERTRSHTYKVINQYQQWRVQVNRTGWRRDVECWWRGLSDGQRIFAPILFVNAMVFFAWRVPAWRILMSRYFCADPGSRAICWPMVLSTFSHYSFMHLSVNMYVLHSFCSAAVATLGSEQFVALYLTSGVMSSLASHIYKIALKRPGPSLGASGAIMGILGFVCLQYPDTRLGIAFLPMITFAAGNAIKGIIAVDVVGCVVGWKYLDHAAHLGGIFWGIFWQVWGNANLWQKRERLLSVWHAIRNPPRSQ